MPSEASGGLGTKVSWRLVRCLSSFAFLDLIWSRSSRMLSALFSVRSVDLTFFPSLSKPAKLACSCVRMVPFREICPILPQNFSRNGEQRLTQEAVLCMSQQQNGMEERVRMIQQAYQKINDLELGSSLTSTDRARSSSSDLVWDLWWKLVVVLLRFMDLQQGQASQFSLWAYFLKRTLDLPVYYYLWQLAMFIEYCAEMKFRVMEGGNWFGPCWGQSRSVRTCLWRQNWGWLWLYLVLAQFLVRTVWESWLVSLKKSLSLLAKDSMLQLSYRLCLFLCRKFSQGCGISSSSEWILSMAASRLHLKLWNSMKALIWAVSQ